MTDASVHCLLPVDESAPPERLRWPLLLAVAASVILVHLALFTVFTPLAPEPVGNASRGDHATSFLSSRAVNADPVFLKTVDMYDPISFLHPPEAVGFSFFRTAQMETGPDAPFELPLPEKTFSASRPPQIALAPVIRPLLPDVSDSGSEKNLPAAAPAYPYWAADSVSGVVFPAFQLSATSERILQRQKPSNPSVFQIKAPVLPDLPYEAVLEESCGVSDLDLAARAWLDTLLNSSGCPAGLKSDRGFCRVVWSAKAFGKEPSTR